MTFPTDKSTHSFVHATVYYVAGIVQALRRAVQKNGHLPKIKGYLTLRINYKAGRKFPLFTDFECCFFSALLQMMSVPLNCQKASWCRIVLLATGFFKKIFL